MTDDAARMPGAGPDGRYRLVSSEVYYATQAIPAVGEQDCLFLKQAAARNDRHRCRVCLHPDPAAQQQEMLIAALSRTYIRPHWHLGKSEAFCVIEGVVDAVLFGRNGSIDDVIEMGPPGSGRNFLYRMPEGVCHGLLIRSEWLVFVETTVGPFDPRMTGYAEWAPDDKDTGGIPAFADAIRSRVDAFLKARNG